MWTLATQIDTRARAAERRDREQKMRGQYLFKFLSTDDELEGAIGKWNSSWHIEETGDVAVGREMLQWRPLGGGTAPRWLIGEEQFCLSVIIRPARPILVRTLLC